MDFLPHFLRTLSSTGTILEGVFTNITKVMPSLFRVYSFVNEPLFNTSFPVPTRQALKFEGHFLPGIDDG